MASRRRRAWGTVRLRMTLAATLLVAAAMLVGSWLLVASVRASLRQDQRNESTQVLNGALREIDVRLSRGLPATQLPPASSPGFSVLIMNDRGQVIGGTPGVETGNISEALGATVGHRIIGEDGTLFPEAIAGERHVWFVGDRIYDFVPINLSANSSEPSVYLVATGPSGAIDSAVGTLETTLWWAIPILVVVVGLVAWSVTGRALRPVETIRKEVTAITHSHLDRRVSEPRAQDEVGRLARTMNEMLDRLQDSAERQQQFVSDASHELRSPVAAMRATGEVALAHPEVSDWPAVVRRMLIEDDRMEHIVGDLLDLARGEESDLPDTTVDLDDVAIDETARARRSGIAISTGGISAGRVRGSAEQLTRVVRNLLDNATRHATARVRVGLATDGDTVTLTVEDDGPGIPYDDRERVFERFTRLDEGRARDQGGLGLGLAMVRTIAVRHGGTATITDPVDPAYPGARVAVQFPAIDS